MSNSKMEATGFVTGFADHTESRLHEIEEDLMIDADIAEQDIINRKNRLEEIKMKLAMIRAEYKIREGAKA